MRFRLRDIFAVFFGVCLLLNLSGCSGGQELHEKFIIEGIAVDKEDNRYKLTAQAYDFQTPKDEKEPSIRIVEVSGITLLEALENIKNKTNLNPVYLQNVIILMGEEVAKSGVNNFIDFFIRHCEARPKVKLCVCSGKASDLLKVKDGEKPIKAQNIHDLIPDELNSDVMHFVGDVYGKISDSYAAWLGLEDKNSAKEVVFKGVALFKGDSLCCMLEKDDAFGFMIFKNIPKFSSCVVKNNDFGEVTCSVTKSVVKIVPEIREKAYPKFRIDLGIDMSAFAFDSSYKDVAIEGEMDNLESDIENKLRYICEPVLKKIVSYGLDVFSLGKILRNTNPEYFRSIGGEWKNIINKCEYEINEQVKVGITGKEPI